MSMTHNGPEHHWDHKKGNTTTEQQKAEAIAKFLGHDCNYIDDYIRYITSDAGTVAMIEKLMDYRIFSAGKDKDNGDYWTALGTKAAVYKKTLNAALQAAILEVIKDG